MLIGVDIGTTRIRLAMGKRYSGGRFAVTAVATKDLDGEVSGDGREEPDRVTAAIEDLVKELGAARRACVLSLTPPSALLCIVRLPSTSVDARRKAARCAAERFALWRAQGVASVIRAHWVDAAQGLLAIGIAREDVLKQRLHCVRRAGLRVAGVDHNACALRRAFPRAHGVVDIGHRASTLHAFLPGGPLSSVVPAGGVNVTRGIAKDLGIDDATAEQRKRIFGTAGAGESVKGQLVDAIRRRVEAARKRGVVRRLALVGNGSRLAGLAEAIESATQTTVDVPASDVLRSGRYPEDVVRAAAPDWTLAASLATWTPC
jgi:Tfp pilus assembly PilM family ATPase